MKALMISIKPKYVAKILNGEKTIEIRKTCPSVFKHLHSYEGASLVVYIYCTKDKTNILHKNRNGWFANEMNVIFVNGKPIYENYNGKVVAKFTLNKIRTSDMTNCLQGSCLSYNEVNEYTKGKKFYGWVIDNLVIFDKPKELREFVKCDDKHIRIGNCFIGFGGIPRLTKAPQSWCYVEVE